MKYPEKIYIQNDAYSSKEELEPLAWLSVEEADNGELAIYELKKVVNKKTKTIIEE